MLKIAKPKSVISQPSDAPVMPSISPLRALISSGDHRENGGRMKPNERMKASLSRMMALMALRFI